MLLTLIFVILIFSLIVLFYIPEHHTKTIRKLALLSSGTVLILSCFLLSTFNSNVSYFQNVNTYSCGLDFLNIYITVGLDGISIFFFILSSFLIFLCLLFIWEEKLLKQYVMSLLLMDLLLLLVFSVLDLLLFYIFFEAILIPMYLIIGVWGSRERKVRAVYLFFFYTLIGSLCLLLGIIYIYYTVGTLNFEYINAYNFTFYEQYWLWLAFFFFFFI